MSLYSQFKMDNDKEVNGIIVEMGANSKGDPIKFRIARAVSTNENYAKILEQETRPYRRIIDANKLPKKTDYEIQVRVFVRSLLLGWEGVEDENNQPMEFNKENALKLLTDLPELFRDLQAEAFNANNFRAEALENEAKN